MASLWLCRLLFPLLLAAGTATGEDDGNEVVELSWSFPRRRLAAGNATVHLPRLSLDRSLIELQARFHYKGMDYQLNLRQNRELLPASATHTVLNADGTITEGPKPRPCHFLGEVAGVLGSSVGLSTCTGGLTGVVLAFDKVISVEPAEAETGLVVQPLGAEGEPEGSRQHVVRRLTDERALDYIADVSKFAGGPRANQESGRLLTASSTKYVEVYVVNDNTRYQAFGGESGLATLADHSVSVMNQVTAMYRNPPTNQASFPHTIQVVLVGQQTFKTDDPWESTVQKVGQETDCSSLLDLFSEWGLTQSSAGSFPQNDNRVLLSGRDFDGSTVGLAYMSTMCMQSRTGSVNMCARASTAAQITGCASVVAHEMGHNFGMHHDSSGNACPGSGLIMEAVGGGVASDQFSSCSATYITEFFNEAYADNGACLDNSPTRVVGDPICGNGFIEEGEVCDCGSADCSSVDPCCNGGTCQFADPSYQCSSATSVCCESCLFVAASANKVCRSANSVCDLPEHCPGGTAECPRDAFVYPGKSCTIHGKAGLCLAGTCESLDATCSVDVHRDFDGNWDLTETCAGYNDDCGFLVCHDKDYPSNDFRCRSQFFIHGKAMKVPEGTPCWFPGSPRGTRPGMCHDGVCKLPFQLAVVPLCGNGGIDYNEECDCGSATTDTCCDCSTCKLKAGMQCQSSEACCDSNCQFRPAGTECRAAAGTCDLAETCSGTSSICPSDVGKQWGTECYDDGVVSTCYGKVCVDNLDKQCAAKNSQRPWGGWYPDRTPDTNNRCTALSCCQSCSELTNVQIDGRFWSTAWFCSPCTRSVSTFTFTDAEGNEETIHLGAPVEGTVLSDRTKICKLGQTLTPDTSCTSGKYLDNSVGQCLPCSTGCTECTGPTSFDCTGNCAHGVKDTRGACPISAEQVSFAGPITTLGPTPAPGPTPPTPSPTPAPGPTPNPTPETTTTETSTTTETATTIPGTTEVRAAGATTTETTTTLTEATTTTETTTTLTEATTTTEASPAGDLTTGDPTPVGSINRGQRTLGVLHGLGLLFLAGFWASSWVDR